MSESNRKSFNVSDAELAVLQVLWSTGSARVAEVQELVNQDGRNWAYNTVQTLLTRLESKGVASSERRGRANCFSARFNRDEFLNEQIDDLAQRVFDGARAGVVMAFVESKGLSRQEIRELRDLLDRIEDTSEAE